MSKKKKYTTATFREMKKAGEPIVMVTAYDYPTAKLADEAGAEMVLVGDSLGMVVLGFDSTIPVTLDDMIHHTKAVTRATKNSFVVTDLPFMSYRIGTEETLKSAARVMQEGLAKAVKLEGGSELCPIIEQLVQGGIPVVGHIGLTPQSVFQLGGYKVQGKSAEDAAKLLEDALALQEAGICSLVLECVPHQLARLISEKLEIPTIGIGAGPDCDGQVLVFHDLVQYASSIQPKFVKPYAAVGDDIKRAFMQYAKEVKTRQFPTLEHSFTMKDETIQQLYGEN
ncbi:3-methyl-2-oxobutanoate hydroxymethyltransferase [Ammoniphilus oxalaticus]|uniref:3-methyl-2-oxobutanoate hydroxymethyltransferase n=1 Tax=Ammoniphilus oxalaticus TaxID=66863 RepID=A0A419SN68_9BACL|nr:3-methyl-2-oxobutanoate hydroxymethyltransferase [Ammoniphilus oxalaticus]RKD25746.1 3-methyl-2-oxobutanoate hydroxymethyltransferase [Ammoniphilus oxalaticus]